MTLLDCLLQSRKINSTTVCEIYITITVIMYFGSQLTSQGFYYIHKNLMLICNIYTHILTHTYSHIAFVMFEREVKSIHIFKLTVLLPCLHITSNIYEIFKLTLLWFTCWGPTVCSVFFSSTCAGCRFLTAVFTLHPAQISYRQVSLCGNWKTGSHL